MIVVRSAACPSRQRRLIDNLRQLAELKLETPWIGSGMAQDRCELAAPEDSQKFLEQRG